MELIQQELSKLTVLKNEVARREQRIAMLTAMREGDKFDAVLSEVVPLDSSPVTAPVVSDADESKDFSQPQKQRAKGEVKRALLLALSPDALGIESVRQKVVGRGMDLTYDHVRTQLWSFTKDADGFVASPLKGHYQLTEKGIAFVEKLKGESPAATGLSGATKSDTDEL